MLGKIEGRRRGRQRMRWLDGITDSMIWVWVDSGSWWWTGRPGMLQFMEWQRVGHYWATELNWMELLCAVTLHPVTRKWVLLSHWLVHQRCPPSGNQFQWATPMTLLRHWTAQQWAPPTSNQVLRMDSSEGIQPKVACWSSGEEWDKRWILAFSLGPFSSSGLWSVRELGHQENRLGTMFCRTSEPSSSPPLALAQALRQQWTSPPSLSLGPNSSSGLPGSQDVGCGVLLWLAWEAWGPDELGAWLPQWWQLVRVWGTWPWRNCHLSSASC